MRSKLFAIVALVVVASMVLTACTPPAAPTPETIIQTVVVEKQGTPQVIMITATPAPTEPAKPTEPPAPEKKVLRLNMGPGDIPTLDPAVAEDTSSVQIIEVTGVGLSRLNEEAYPPEIVPGMAEKWDVSQDGKTYTFHLRKDVPWVKYDAAKKQVVKVQTCDAKDRMVTAGDFAYGILRTIAPETASPYAYLPGMVLVGADDYTNGKEKDPAKVGVKVIDDATLELTFKEEAAFNVNIAGLWLMHAQPKWIIEGDDCTTARKDKWTETGLYQTYGPFAMKEWVHDSSITLVKNPFWPGDKFTPQAKIEEVTWSMLDEAPAFADYEAGNLDIANVPQADLDRVKADPDLSKQYKQGPALATYYYGFNTTAKFVDDVRVRRALSMAVDRKSLVENVTKAGQEPAQWFCRPGLVACPTLKDYPDLGVKYNVEEAKKLLDEYMKEKNLTLDKIDISLMFNTSSGHQKIAEAVQQMWKANLGLDVKIVNQEWKVYLKTTKSKDTPQVFRMGWNLDYPDANNFDREVCAAGGSMNPTDKTGKPEGGFMWKNDTFEKLLVDAAKEKDNKKRTDMYAQIEKILVWDDAVMIPLYWYTRSVATKPYVARTFSSTGSEHIEKWDITK